MICRDTLKVIRSVASLTCRDKVLDDLLCSMNPSHPTVSQPLLLPCYQFAQWGWLALDERLLTQLLISRTKKYMNAHVTKLDVPVSIHEDLPP